MAEPLPEHQRFSLIIPVLNEAACLEKTLAGLFSNPWIKNHCEVVIADGGSNDGSREIAATYPCRLLQCERGRAAQMNAASRVADGEMLLFLHADSQLPENFGDSIPADAGWGFFRLRLDGGAAIFRLIESAINLRTRLSRVAGGDQGLFFSRKLFDSLGGFPQIPLMEDVAICKLARQRAAPLIVDSRIVSSSRRWQERGVVRTVLLMWSLRLAYWLGVDPVRLHRIYYPEHG